jgi:hypothetical protein
MEAQGKANASQDQERERNKEEFVRKMLWRNDGFLHLHVYQAEGRVHMRHSGEWPLPVRVLTPQERKTLIDACLTELPHRDSVFAVLTDFDKFCQLLRQPENHVLSATPVYVEREVNTYTTAEMTNQMVQELIDLRPHNAYVKSAWKGKIQTVDFSSAAGAIFSAGRRDVVDVHMSARQNAIRLGILKPRSVIDTEILGYLLKAGHRYTTMVSGL